jgi:hypothetical protein
VKVWGFRIETFNVQLNLVHCNCVEMKWAGREGSSGSFHSFALNKLLVFGTYYFVLIKITRVYFKVVLKMKGSKRVIY